MKQSLKNGPLLLSIDLEDVRDWVEDGFRYQARVSDNVKNYLEKFSRWHVKATFFVVGKVARRYPELIEEIISLDHEIACHGDSHLQLDKMGPREFYADLKKNIATLTAIGAKDIRGFRAPTFSLTKQTCWAYEIMQDLGICYSSSVLPANNPLYGWAAFGEENRKIGKVWEIPVSVHHCPGFRIPMAGGVYFRVLPFFLTRMAINKRTANGQAVTTYFHPYDIDTKQEFFMHPDLNNKKHLNILMYIGRKYLLDRLESLYDKGLSFLTYSAYIKDLDVSHY